MADLLLTCQEGKRFDDADRSAIDALFYRRFRSHCCNDRGNYRRARGCLS
jgi:hypothetical protein